MLSNYRNLRLSKRRELVSTLCFKTPKTSSRITRAAFVLLTFWMSPPLLGVMSNRVWPTAESRKEWTVAPSRLIRSAMDQGDQLDLLDAALRLDPARPSRRFRRRIHAEVDELASIALGRLPIPATVDGRVEALNALLFKDMQVRGELAPASPRGLSIRSLLEERQGTCVSLVILYLALAERLSLEATAAATPTHLFVRVQTSAGAMNIETLDGGASITDSVYRKRHPMADESINSGVFMTPLSKQAVLAHLLNNRGVLAARIRNHAAAIHEFDSALLLGPAVNAAYYNRGLSDLALEHPGDAIEDFSHAIELHPLDAQAYNNRGIAHLRLKESELAREDFGAALRIKPAMREARENLNKLDEFEAVRTNERPSPGS